MQPSFRDLSVQRAPSSTRLRNAGFALAFVALMIARPHATRTSHLNGTAPKKVVYYGWGLPDTQYAHDHWREMEEMPFDGIGILVAIDRAGWQKGNRGNPNQLGWQMMGTRRFRHEEFRDTIDDLKSIPWQQFTDNFLPVALSTGVSASGLNWFDEERWNVIADNFRVLARIAEQCGAKGLILDPEHYGYALFSYAEQRNQVDRSFEDYAAMARRRGREVMNAIAGEQPDAVLLSFYAYSLVEAQMRGRASLSDIRYSLLASFYDGLLEAMPDEAQLIDGFEFAYGYKTRERFLNAYKDIHGTAASFSSVPGRYRRLVSAGFGLRIDNQDGFDYFSSREFGEALRHALDVSDRYVWVYGQIPRFFPRSGIAQEYINAIAVARRAVGVR